MPAKKNNQKNSHPSNGKSGVPIGEMLANSGTPKRPSSKKAVPGKREKPGDIKQGSLGSSGITLRPIARKPESKPGAKSKKK